MKLRFKVIDRLLADTKSKPEDLLKWVKEAVKRPVRYPCLHYPYMGEYSLWLAASNYTSRKVYWREERRKRVRLEIGVGTLIGETDIYTFYLRLRHDQSFREDAIASFKKHYGLK